MTFLTGYYSDSLLQLLRIEIDSQIGYITIVMKNHKSLLHTNSYLRNKKTRERLIIEHAAVSAKIEGVPNAKKRAERLSRKSFNAAPSSTHA